MNCDELKTEFHFATRTNNRNLFSLLHQLNDMIEDFERAEQRHVQEADIDAMIEQLAKQKKEALSQSSAGNDREYTNTLTEQITFLERHLPR